jgi:TetR/AcrR family transcriptional regulator
LSAVRPRLAAEERRAALLDTACLVFSRGSYRGVTTAEIAREAGVTEPILYRHFASKRDLYFACVDEAWRRVRSIWDCAASEGETSEDWIGTVQRSMQEAKEQRILLASLWVQALAEANEDPEIRKYLRRHLREVHDSLADGIRRAQEAGLILADRDAAAEAWLIVGSAILGTIWQRLGVMSDDDVAQIKAARRLWITGTA